MKKWCTSSSSFDKQKQYNETITYGTDGICVFVSVFVSACVYTFCDIEAHNDDHDHHHEQDHYHNVDVAYLMIMMVSG